MIKVTKDIACLESKFDVLTGIIRSKGNKV